MAQTETKRPFETLYTFDETEKPLDFVVHDGGLCTIFQKVAVVGDSLTAGTLEQDPNIPWDADQYPDCEPYSWGAYMARDCGFTVYNFARGGMKAKEYVETWADEKGYWDEKYRAQVYIIALGCNDKYTDQPVGAVSDINFADYTQNEDSFVGDYAQIIQHYKKISPDAFFFLVTEPRMARPAERQARVDAQNDAMRAIADVFKQCYVIDLAAYGPYYDDAFRKRFFLRGHLNPMGYRFTAQMIESYIDYYIRRDPKAFYDVGFMDTVYYTLGDKAKTE